MNYIENFASVTGMFYSVIWLLTLYIFFSQKKVLDSLVSTLIMVFAIIFLGFRDEYSGTDTIEYKRFFDYRVYLDDYEMQIEPGFELFVNLISLFSNFQGFLVIAVLIQLIIIYYISRWLKIEYSSIVLLSYISMFPGFDMLINTLRQGLATNLALMIWTLAFFNQRVYRESIFTVLLLHKSMLLYLPIYLANRLKLDIRLYSNKLLPIFILIMLIFWIFIGDIAALNLVLLKLDYQIFGSNLTLGEKLINYMVIDDDMLSGIFKYYFLLISLVFSYFALKYMNNLMKLDTNYSALLFLFLVFTSVYAFFWGSSYSFRFMYMSFLPGILITTLVITVLQRSLLSFSYFIFIFISAVLTYGSNTYNNFNNVLL